MLELSFTSQLDCGSYIISIDKTASKKFGALIRPVKFLSAMLLCISINLRYRYTSNTIVMSWTSASSCFLELLDKLQKRICRTVGPSLAVSLESLAHRQNVVSLSFFYRYYFGRCSSELAQLVLLTYSRGRSICYSDRLHDFSITITRCYKEVYVNSFFPRTAKFWNSLPICLLLTFDLNGFLNGFKSRINRHLLSVDSF